MAVKDWLTPEMRASIERLSAACAVPSGVAIGWIECESGGNFAEVTSLDERGWFQQTPDESRLLGLSPREHRLLSSNRTFSLFIGFKLVDYYRSRTQQAMFQTRAGYIPYGSEYAWRLVKLSHSYGIGGLRVILSDAVAAGPINTLSWDHLASFAMNREKHYLATIKHSPTKWIMFVNQVFDVGKQYGPVEGIVCTNSGGPLTGA